MQLPILLTLTEFVYLIVGINGNFERVIRPKHAGTSTKINGPPAGMGGFSDAGIVPM
jgi:hypothetical protein